jgi:hypothetical protein
MKLSRTLLPIFLFFVVLCAGCGFIPSSQKPDTLQVVRTDIQDQSAARIHTWTIINAQAVQQLFDEVQGLPMHHNTGADSCARSRYSYTLNFLAGKKSLQTDELYTYCFTLTFPDGSQHDPTDAFNSQFASMLHLSTKELTGF